MALTVALALTAAPVLSCCLAFVGPAHAAGMEKPLSGHVSGTSMHDHCGDVEAAPGPAPDEERSCGDCAPCDFVQPAANTISGKSALVTHVEFTPLAAVAPSRPDFTPALLRTTAPPQGPPIPHATPVLLNTTLRL